MKKVLLLSVLLLIFCKGQSQVGINTTTPDAQLQIKSSNQATPANNDGILIPKIDAFPITNPTAAQNSMMVYLTTTSVGKQPGFYYWDNGTASWKSLGDTASNWTLTGANLANNNSGNVGIGTGAAVPSSLLTVKKDGVGFTQEDASGVSKIGFFTLASDAWLQTHSNSDLKFATNNGATQMTLQKATGNLGINVINPSEKLEVAGKIKTTNLQVTNGAALNNLLVSDAAGNAVWQTPNTTLNSFAWKTTGNSGTNPATNFIGTTDNQPIYFRANNLPVGRIEPGNLSSVFFGADCGTSIGGYYNVGIGYATLKNLSTGVENVGIGLESLRDNTQGSYNLGLGVGTLKSNTSGINNTAIGYSALSSNKAGSGAVAIGRFAMNYANDTTVPFDNKNIAIGFEALKGSATPANNTGNSNTAIGYQTLLNNTSGASNIAIGTSSLYTNTTGFSNTAIGNEALFSNTTGNGNTALGLKSLNKNTIGGDNTATGYFALLNNIDGLNNTANGVFALRENTAGDNNTATGKSALYSNTTGNNNTASGRSALFLNKIGENNVAVGFQTLNSNGAGSNATAIGTNAMQNVNNTTTAFINQNVAVGYEALRGSPTPANNTGNSNTAIGYQTLLNNSKGTDNIAFGANSLKNNTTASKNIAIGTNSLLSQVYSPGYEYDGDNIAIGFETLLNTNSTNTYDGIKNIAIGSSSLKENTIGTLNIGLGYNTLSQNISGYSNLAIGYKALENNTTGNENIAIGDGSLIRAKGSDNVAIGKYAMVYAISGDYNVSLGSNSLLNNKAGSRATAIGANAMLNANDTAVAFDNKNVAVGYEALRGSPTSANNTGNSNTALGYQSLLVNSSGSGNSAVGDRSLFTNTTGSFNNSFGYLSLANNTTGSQNNAHGSEALLSNTTGDNNSGFGYRSLNGNTVGSDNCAFGNASMLQNKSGNKNTAVGYRALGSQTFLNGGVAFDTNNVAIGYDALWLNNPTTTANGINNTAVGKSALSTNTTGSRNVAVGGNALLGITNGNYNTSVGTFSYNVGNYSNSSSLGDGVFISASNQVRIGDAGVASIGGFAVWTSFSDKRFKKDIQQNVPGLDFIKKLKPVTYHLDMDAIAHLMKTTEELRKKESEKLKGDILQTGFIAQEVEASAKELGFDFSGVDAPKNESDFYGLRYAEFVVPLVKAVQEQQEIIDNLNIKIKNLETINSEILKRLEKLENK